MICSAGKSFPSASVGYLAFRWYTLAKARSTNRLRRRRLPPRCQRRTPLNWSHSSKSCTTTALVVPKTRSAHSPGGPLMTSRLRPQRRRRPSHRRSYGGGHPRSRDSQSPPRCRPKESAQAVIEGALTVLHDTGAHPSATSLARNRNARGTAPWLVRSWAPIRPQRRQRWLRSA